MRKRSQSGRVKGYQPTLTEFNELLELSQRGIDSPHATAELTYQHGSETVATEKNVATITTDHLLKLIKESGEARQLINLKFSAQQEDPFRKIDVNIDLDGWTYYTVEATDYTWMLGRFHELTEMLLINRRHTAKASFPLPAILTPKQRYVAWGSAVWITERDWRVTLIRIFKEMPAFLTILIVLAFIAKRPSIPREVSFGSFAIFYAACLFMYNQWLRGKYRSCVQISRSRLTLSSCFLTIEMRRQSIEGFFSIGIISAIVSILTLIVAMLR